MLIFYQLLPHFHRLSLVIIVIVGVLSSFLASRIWRLVIEVVVVGAVLLLSAAVSLLMAAYDGFCASSLAASCHCRRRRRHPN